VTRFDLHSSLTPSPLHVFYALVPGSPARLYADRSRFAEVHAVLVAFGLLAEERFLLPLWKASPSALTH
jgi:hypothetical protein